MTRTPAGTQFEREVALRWHDLDAAGHVNHADVLTLAEEARNAWFASLEVPLSDYVVVRIVVNYKREITLADSPVVVRVGLVRTGRTSLETTERILGSAGQIHAELETTVVLWDPESNRPRSPSEAEELRIHMEAARS